MNRAAALLMAAAACAHRASPQQVDFQEPVVIEADAVQAEFDAAVQEHDDGKLDAAAARLHALAQRPGLPAVQKGSALLQEGVCRIEAGARDEGERLLTEALAILDAQARQEQVDPTLGAQAEFWLGEADRGRFRDAPLDPAAMDQAALGAALERKAQLLLSAQDHYLRCIRRGDPDWSAAAGYWIGEMYEALYDELVSAAEPRSLTAAQRDLYRNELHGRVRVLLEKAIRIYDETLAAAERTGASGAFVEKTGQALERIKRLLAEDSRG